MPSNIQSILWNCHTILLSTSSAFALRGNIVSSNCIFVLLTVGMMSSSVPVSCLTVSRSVSFQMSKKDMFRMVPYYIIPNTWMFHGNSVLKFQRVAGVQNNWESQCPQPFKLWFNAYVFPDKCKFCKSCHCLFHS